MAEHEWLSLIEVSGPFLAVPVLEKAFPQGLDGLDPNKKRMLRQAYDEWREALELDDPQLPELHRAWIDLVLKQGLELDEDGDGDVLKSADRLPCELEYRHPDYGITLRPDYAVVDDQRGDQPMMLVVAHDPDVDLDGPLDDAWAATPVERMAQLCRATETRLGLVTNGERWMLVDAPVGGVTTYASWYARLWSQEPVTLQAFVTLLGIRRFFTAREEQLPAMLDDSLQHQDEVTEALGEQVRRAVEVLIQALDKADLDRNRELLRGVEPEELYEAALTVMMRLVFLLSAEERELMDVVKDERFEAYYAVSSLRMQLREQAGLHSEEILAHRRDAWSRLLAIFRAVYGGIEHEALRMPALGGSLFDPDRFPFLEGRAKGTHWRTDEARPLPIDNRTVLLLLESIQTFQGRTLSYRALDVENIGYVYEGLLERTVERGRTVVLELKAGKDAKKTLYTLEELESLRGEGIESLVDTLSPAKGIKRSKSAIRKDLQRPVEADDLARLLTACHNDQALCDRVAPFYHLLRIDCWGYPLVYPEGAYMVTTGTDRRETGTHYTPKPLTEDIVEETLEPLVYVGPAEGRPREEWELQSPTELLDLKICDPAMGSGAFLVQVCRWLSERLLEAWERSEADGKAITVDGEVMDALGTAEPLPTDPEERLVAARRFIAEHCIYGVDVNPMAVELAKLSIWLVTLAKGRPFGFLDHNLRAGNSLLGIHDLDQLRYLDMDPKAQGSGRKLFAQALDQAVDEAIELRSRLRWRVIRDIHDVEVMAKLDREARQKLELPELVADALVGEVLTNGGKTVDMAALAIEVGQAIEGDEEAIVALGQRADEALSTDLPAGKSPRHPMHWPLAFPEVFVRENGGFDAIVGNPPFMGNRLWKKNLGEHFPSLAKILLGRPPGKIDLCVLFHRRAVDLLRRNGTYGLLAQTNIAEGSAIDVGLGEIVKQGDIYWSRKGMPWPGRANVITAIVCFYKGTWRGSRDADGNVCDRIGSRLEPEAKDSWIPKRLKDRLFSFAGVDNSKGLAFVIGSDDPWFDVLQSEPDTLLRSYVTGDDITSHALRNVRRWALDIGDRTLREIEERWPQAYRFLMEVVRPTRTADALKSYKGLHERWWQFWNHRADLMRRLRQRDRCIVFSKVTKYPICMLAPSRWIYTNQVVLIGMERPDMPPICLGSFFQSWLQDRCGANLGVTLRLSIKEAMDTFPLPLEEVAAHGLDAAHWFNEIAVQWSRENGCGLTEVMNAYHSPETDDPAIQQLRDLHRQIDEAVAGAYGWGDMDLANDFHEVGYLPENDRVRWSISEKTRLEVLRRLARLNKERYEEEVRQGLYGSKAMPKPKRIPRRVTPSTNVVPLFPDNEHPFPSESQADLPMAAEARATYGIGSRSSPRDEDHARAILAFLEANPGWHAKSAILNTTGIPPNRWSAVINKLMTEDKIVRRGERRGARYRACAERKENGGNT